MIRLIASDMDGTLLNSKKEFDDEFFNILQELLNKEIYFVIASGNQFHHLYNQFLPYSDDLYFISENGSFITKGKKELYSFTMDQYDVQTIYDVLKQISRNYVCILLEGKKCLIFLDNIKLFKRR